MLFEGLSRSKGEPDRRGRIEGEGIADADDRRRTRIGKANPHPVPAKARQVAMIESRSFAVRKTPP
jgi:hypothetical protein